MSDIFEYLDKTKPGVNNEIQLTDALRMQCKDRPVFGYHYEGTRDDVGSRIDYVMAQVKYGLRRPELREDLLQFLKEQVILEFRTAKSHFLNSNGVDFGFRKSQYDFTCMFTAKEGEDTSSFNYTGFVSTDLERDFRNCGSIDELLRQSQEQVSTKTLPGKFVGDVVITPDCMTNINGCIESAIGNHALISGTSVFKDKLNHEIADTKFTLRSLPLADDLTGGHFVTGDGYKAENMTVIDKGVLNCFLLNRYGSIKTGQERAVNDGGNYVVEPGDTSFADMISSVEKGILMCRFSGASPSVNGDLSGVAKNSYYIEDGKIQFPLSETMISGNLVSMLMNIKSVSRERVHFGSGILPWMQMGGITISGK